MPGAVTSPEKRKRSARAAEAFFFENGPRRCMLYGGSMEPFLSYGEIVRIVKVTLPLVPGRCYAYISGKKLAIHRFVRKSGAGHGLFAGDNSMVFDRVPVSNIIGELSSCGNRGIGIIISMINYLFCAGIRLWGGSVRAQRFRVRMIRVIAGQVKKKAGNDEEKI